VPAARQRGTTPGGAYGLALPDLDAAGDLLVPAPRSWTRWRVGHEPGPLELDPGEDFDRLDDERGRLRLAGGGLVLVDRATHSSTLRLPDAPPAAHVAHPYLSTTALVAARWAGWQSFHAAAFMADGGAWAVLGDKGRGKSSTLAGLAELGVTVVTDDILVVDRDGLAKAGPRCIDLRGDVARALALGKPLGRVGARERWRVQTGPGPPSTPLRGWVTLEWGAEVGLEPLPVRELLPLLFEGLGLRAVPHNSQELLDLAALPAWRLTRQRSLDALQRACQELVAGLEQSNAKSCSGCQGA